MTRILCIINRLNLGGPAFHVAILTKNLKENFEVLLVAGTPQNSEESSSFVVKDMGLTFISLDQMHRSLHPFRDYESYKKIRKIIRDFKPDIVHTHAAKAGALGRMAARKEKVPVIVHTFHGHIFHSYFHPLKSKIFLWIERFLARRSSAIIAISDRQKYDLSQHYRLCEPSKMHMIPLGFDLSRFQENVAEKRKLFRDKFFIEEDELAVGIIGRLVPVKNHSMFLRAAADILSKTKKKVRFLIIGDGESRNALLRESKSLGLNTSYYPDEQVRSTVTFCSWMKEVDVCIAGLDIVTLCSFNEGTPVSLIEAQAGNKPIVSTNVGGIENVVRRNETALLVNINNYDSFAEALLSVIEDDDLRKQLSLKGWNFVKEKFHYTRMINDMTKLYNSLLDKYRRQ